MLLALIVWVARHRWPSRAWDAAWCSEQVNKAIAQALDQETRIA
jgi:hypothetical protein